MVARVVAAALTLVITGAPAVTSVCEGICAARAGAAGTTHEHHSCHQEASPSTGAAMTSTAHACGHVENLPSALSHALWSLTAPAVATTASPVVPPVVAAPAYLTARADHSPPNLLSSNRQLRI